MKIFVPLTDTLSDGLMEKLGLTLDDLVPFDLEYEVFRPESAAQDGSHAPSGDLRPATMS